MSFQSTIYSTQALGKQGTVSRLNPLVKIPVVAEGNNVIAGGFVVEGTNPQTQVVGLSAATSAVTAVAGVAVFEKMQPAINGLNGLNGVQLNEGEELAKVIKGYVFVKAMTQAVHGQVVGVDPASGEIRTANSAGALPSAAAGKEVFTGANAKLASFQAISAGTLQINVDGAISNYTAIDLHSAASLSDVATALSSAISGASVTVTNTNDLTITSSASSAASKIEVLGGTVGEILLSVTHTATAGNSAFIDTGWKVETGAAAGQVCEIFNI